MFRLIPVLDLKGGVVVRGVAGRRAEYRPVEGILSADAAPGNVGKAMIEKLGLSTAYVADLDAIGGAEPAWETYRELMECGLRLWVDAGAGDPTRAARLAEFSANGSPLDRIIAGLESLADVQSLAAITAAVSPERLVFSLDLKEGRPLVSGNGWQLMEPIDIADAAAQLGVRSIIVLDLARVGVGDGVGTLELCRELRQRLPDIELIGGGGVRTVEDLRAMRSAGCDAALVASALHDGRITAADIAALSE